MQRFLASALAILVAASSCAQRSSNNPYEQAIANGQDEIVVNYIEFATIPDENSRPPRLMHMLAEPGGDRFFVSSMRGRLYVVSSDGSTVDTYLDINDSRWQTRVQSAGNERGLQSFAFHPQFNQRGTPGYGRFYTFLDTAESTPDADFMSGGSRRSHDTVLLEWTADDPSAPVYTGTAPRELFRAAQPYSNHNGGQIAFNPGASPGEEDFGLLYIGLADGGSGGDPLGTGQDLGNAFGKILRIDPLGSNSANGHYGIPGTNPFVGGESGSLGEIYAYGVRNPQRFNWDPDTGQLLVADIGQNRVEEISPVAAGANLGWALWEGSFRHANRRIDLNNPRGAAGMTWPIAEYDHDDPLFRQRQVAVTGVAVFRDSNIPQLRNKIVFGDNPNGELFYVDADTPANGGQQQIGRILLNDGDTDRPPWQLIQQASREQGRGVSNDADLRFGHGNDDQLFLLNKRDGIIRLLVPDRI